MSAANHLYTGDVEDLLGQGDARRRQGSYAQRLIALSGVAPRTMRYAMLELCTPAELAAMPIAGRPRPGSSDSLTRYACPRCTSGAAGTWGYAFMTVWSRQEDVLLCLRHRLLADIRHRDLSGQQDILAANRRHRGLIRRYGRGAVLRAVADATPVIAAQRDRPEGYETFWQRVEAIGGSRREFGRSAAPVFAASQYPEVIALARMLLSPYWRGLLLDGWPRWVRQDPQALTYWMLHDSPNVARFTTEARRTVLPGFRWLPATWIVRELRGRGDCAPMRASCRGRHAPPAPAGPVVWSGEAY